MVDQEKPLKKFAALARKKGSNEPFVTRVIYAESKAAAELWFGEKNWEIDGEVYSRGK